MVLSKRKELDLSSELTECNIQLGSLTQEKTEYDRKVHQRNELLSSIWKNWDITPNANSNFEENGNFYLFTCYCVFYAK